MKLTLTELLIFLCLSNSVLAETSHNHEKPLSISSNLSLHEVVEIAYQRNPQLRVMEARLNHVNALSRRTQSLWVSDPAFSVNHYNDELIDSNGLQEWELGLELPLW